MRELQSRGCVTVRDTDNRLSAWIYNLSTADLLFYKGKMATKYIISHIPRGIIICYTSLHLTHDEGLTF